MWKLLVALGLALLLLGGGIYIKGQNTPKSTYEYNFITRRFETLDHSTFRDDTLRNGMVLGAIGLLLVLTGAVVRVGEGATKAAA